MAQVDVSYYGLYISSGDPHFCTLCKLRIQDDRSMLNYLNYSAWINYGMCQRCMGQYLGFENGFLVTPQRKQKLIQILSKNENIRNNMNQHLRFYLFKNEFAILKKAGYRQTVKKRICMSCNFQSQLSQQNYLKIDKCPKCSNIFILPQFQWKGLQEEK